MGEKLLATTAICKTGNVIDPLSRGAIVNKTPISLLPEQTSLLGFLRKCLQEGHIRCGGRVHCGILGAKNWRDTTRSTDARKDERDECATRACSPGPMVVALAITRALLDVVKTTRTAGARAMTSVATCGAGNRLRKILFGEGVGTSHLFRSFRFFSVPQ